MALKALLAAAVLALAALSLAAGQARAYDVSRGDTLWAISHRTGVPIRRIVHDNAIRDPNHIVVGQHLALPGDSAAPGAAAPAPRPQPVTGGTARRVLVAAANEFGLNPNFVLAVSFLESGYDQAQGSRAGAIRLVPGMGGPARASRSSTSSGQHSSPPAWWVQPPG